MNDNIRELLRSYDIEDILLGIELLHKTGNEAYFKRRVGDASFVPEILFNVLLYDEDGEPRVTCSPYEAIYNYCEQNNYWIYE